MKENMNIILFPLLWEKLMILLKYHAHRSNNGVSLTKEFCNSIGNPKLGGMQFLQWLWELLARTGELALTSAM